MTGAQRLSKEQKIGFVLLLLFAVLVVGLGVLQMRNTVYGPFILRRAAAAAQGTPLPAVDEATLLQQRDTDQDGLNDFEELNFYSTSPYLPDTDSDGVRDKEEIDNGTNPNCAPGTACDTAESAPPDLGPAIIESPLNPQNVPSPLDALAGGLGGGNAIDPQMFLQALQDPQTLRQLLLQTGQITEAQLAQISDADLVALAQDVFGQTQQGAGGVPPGVTTSTP